MGNVLWVLNYNLMVHKKAAWVAMFQTGRSLNICSSHIVRGGELWTNSRSPDGVRDRGV